MSPCWLEGTIILSPAELSVSDDAEIAMNAARAAIAVAMLLVALSSFARPLNLTVQASEQPERRYVSGGGLIVTHAESDEGLYFDVPANEVAYNVQIVRLDDGRYATVYHGEPKKKPGKPGDSIKTALAAGPFDFLMPARRRFAVFGNRDDEQPPLYSPPDGWGGGGNPTVVKGLAPDPFYYVFFLALTDDNRDWSGEDFRHSLCQARTRDFEQFDLLAEVEGRPQWKPFWGDSAAEWRRPWILRDMTGALIQSRDATSFHATQGLIGSVCFDEEYYWSFYTDREQDGKTYLFARKSKDVAALENKRTGWSSAQRISGPLMTGMIIRVAMTRNRSCWAVLYNGYRNGPSGLRQDLFLQYTQDLSVDGPGGLAGVRWYDEFVGDHGVSDAFLDLHAGGGIYAQHCLVADGYGRLAVTEEDARDDQAGGMLTWADFTRGVYGGQVFWAKWQMQRAGFENPILPQRADPWVHRHGDGYYYLTATVPEFDRIELRRSRTIQGLGQAKAQVIWRAHENGPMANHIWAPEIHNIDGRWYVYFAAGTSQDQWAIRIYVLENTATNPLEGEWIEKGQIQTDWESFSLDATTFEHGGTRYLVWAQKGRESRDNSDLYLAAMENPWTLRGRQVCVSKPDLDWERRGYCVNEGAAVLKRNGRIFITYSASATDRNYCMGMLTAADTSDLLDPASWHKATEPVFRTSDENGQYGPGHNCFTVAEDGDRDALIYHARPYPEIRGNPLTDPNRHMRAQIFGWRADGTPDFGVPVPDHVRAEVSDLPQHD